MPSRPTTLLEECHNRNCMPPPDKSITKDIVSLREKRRAHEAWLAKVAEDSVKYLEVPSAQGPSAGLKPKKTKRRRRKRRNPTKKKKKKKPTKKR